MKNNILSEISRVREIMGIIKEQKIKTVVGKEIVTGPMTTALNELVRKKESELLKDWKFYITGDEGSGFGIKLENKVSGVTTRNHKFKYNPSVRRWEETSLFPIRLPMSIVGLGLFEELNRYEDFNYFFSTNTEAADQLRNEIETLTLNLDIFNDGDGGIDLSLVKNKRKYRKGGRVYTRGEGVPITDLTPIGSGEQGSGTNSASVIPENKKESILYLTSGGLSSRYGWLTLTVPVIETEPEIPEIPDVFARDIVFKLQVTDPFEFDSPDITENAKNEIKKGLDRLVGQLEEEGAYEQYINSSVKGKDIIVNAYSSIDAKSDEVGGGDVSDCSPGGTTTRAQYNLCLSQKRAETIVNYLKSEFPEIFGETNLIAKGMGELESPNSVNEPYRLKATDEHIKKYPNLQLKLGQWFRNPPQLKHSNENRVATAADRKFVINMPEFTITKFD